MKLMKQSFYALTVGFLSLPLMVGAAFTDGDTGELGIFGGKILTFINGVLVPFLFAVALVLFIYGAFIFLIQAGGEEESREKGRRFMFWGIIGLVIIVSVWGIVNLIADGLGFTSGTTGEKIDTIIPEAPLD